MGVGGACVAFLIATLPAPVATAVTRPGSLPSLSSKRLARYSVRLSITAMVTGRKYLFFPFKGMLRAEGNTVFASDSENDGEMTLEALTEPNFIFVTGGRKANEVYAKSAAFSVELGVTAGQERIAEWAREYPEWAEGVKTEKRKALPFVLPADITGQMRFHYTGGLVTSCASTLQASYPWPASRTQKLTLFDGILASLALFNHSPFPTSNGQQTSAVPIAPALRDICVTVLPEARSEVEFTEAGPIAVVYHCDNAPDPALLTCRGEVSPHARVEKGFVLDTYTRETIRHIDTGALVSDAIAIVLSGQKGNSIRVTVELRRLNEPTP